MSELWNPSRTAGARWVTTAGLVVGAWALLPPYSGPQLNTAAQVEFVDHVVPGVLVVAISLITLVLRNNVSRLDNALFPAGLGIVLAGIWMTATHVPLVLQATREQAPWGATVHHSLPGLFVVVLGVVWILVFWEAWPSPPAEEVPKP